MTTQQKHDGDIEIEIWSDVACPWCYIGKRRFLSALEEFEGRDRVNVTWRSYQLSPDTPVGERRTELDALVESKGLSAEQVRQMFGHVAQTAADEGLQLDFDTVVAANTFDAHRLIHLAGAKRDAVVEGLFRAHFGEGAVIDDREVLVDIAARAGLDAGTVRAELDSGAGADAVRADIDTARALQVSGVPFFVANRRIAVSGAQPKDVFLQLLTQASAVPVD
ncbi:DsbA family protein [Rhodococcus sp. NCIMB 12038]|uniref:DsbA family oxidoreductase n=1 Tax=Rhodococcus sp. NCIMB 12038 TaxID=933800 RepID=UPI000B3D2C25|nr:DsbA family oxidoreductase [Rhodococcus sp. NCIMB 12038]OUS92749.1 disulfide bond formation protein DsbA [Rhodococcus sp. NCIMB 12038]